MKRMLDQVHMHWEHFFTCQLASRKIRQASRCTQHSPDQPVPLPLPNPGLLLCWDYCSYPMTTGGAKAPRADSSGENLPLFLHSFQHQPLFSPSRRPHVSHQDRATRTRDLLALQLTPWGAVKQIPLCCNPHQAVKITVDNRMHRT